MDLSMLPDFIVEALEHLEDMENSLLQLEKGQDDGDVLNEIFRSIHSIKGAAQYIGLEKVSELSHKLESLLDLIRQGEKQFSQNSLDLFIAVKDRLNLLVDELESSKTEESGIEDLLDRIQKIMNGHSEDVGQSETPEENEVKGFTPFRELARLENEAVDEEYDKELLEIFKKQLNENLVYLQSQIAELYSSVDRRPVLNRCREAVNALYMAANYMGYDMLCEHYSAWQLEIDIAEQEVSSGECSGIDFMQKCLDEVVRVYSQTTAEIENKEDNECSEQEHAVSVEEEPEDFREGLEAALGDECGKTTDTEDSFEEPDPLVNETLDEEYDEELLDIFLQQLNQNIVFLQNQLAEFDSSLDKQVVLSRCRETIKSLFSSANYMGYELLCKHYKAWLVEIDKTEQDVSSGECRGIDSIQMYLNEIIRAYPQPQLEEEQQIEQPDQEDIVSEIEEPAIDGEGLAAALSDVSGATTDNTAALSVGPERLENETLDEEFDEELLDIFLQQLKENIGFLQTQIADLNSSFDKPAVLNRCRDTIKSLYSSANYMGYDMLCNHYTVWQAEIDEAELAVSSGTEMEFDFMQVYLDEIIRVYPESLADLSRQPEPTEQEPEDDFIAGPDQDNLDQALDSIFSDASDQDIDPNTSEDEPVDGEFVAELSGNMASDVDLFGKLSDALDVSLDENGSIPEKQMHGVIEEMIFTSSEQEVEEQDRPENTIAENDTVEEQSAREKAKSEKGEQQGKVVEDTVGPGFSIDKKEEKVAGRSQDKLIAEHPDDKQRLTQKPQEKEEGARKVKQSMRVDADKIDFLMNQVGELVVSRAYFSQLFNEIKTVQQGLFEKTNLTKNELKPLTEFSFRLGEAGVALGRVSNELQEAVMKVRMLPISQLFKRYPRLVRDLVHKSDKQVNLEVKGEETELDKMVIEEMSDPLIHIIRNAVDHGIETVTERKRLGKPEQGTLTLEAYHESNHIVIEITDDGKGIDPEYIKAKIREKELYSDDEVERMTPLELTRIIMLPGFSTAEKTTGTSGRGVGMDVVKKNIDKLNGTIDIESIVGQQTKMRIKIPLTLAIIQALMVRVGKETFTIPLTTVEETLRIFKDEISEIEEVEVIHLRDSTMPIFRLSNLFKVPKKSADAENDKFFVVVVSTGMHEVGLVVDELLGQEEVVIKPLADYLQLDSGFSGATIIGDGAISLILDIPELIKMTTEQQILRQKDLTLKRRTARTGITEQQEQTVH